MRVKELIEILSEYPPDDLVLVNGYEEGLDDILRDNISTIRTRHREDYPDDVTCGEIYGKYLSAEEVRLESCDYIIGKGEHFKAILISRRGDCQ